MTKFFSIGDLLTLKVPIHPELTSRNLCYGVVLGMLSSDGCKKLNYLMPATYIECYFLLLPNAKIYTCLFSKGNKIHNHSIVAREIGKTATEYWRLFIKVSSVSQQESHGMLSQQNA